VPQQDFKQNVKQGFGLDGNVHYKLDRQGIFSLGGELGFLGYGRETKRVPLSSTIGGRITVDLTTSNNIFWMGLGPQITAPSGPIRPYVNGTAGFAVFWTESSVKGTFADEEFASTNNYDDAIFAWTGGAGILIPVGQSKQGAIDIGARWHGQREYPLPQAGGGHHRPPEQQRAAAGERGRDADAGVAPSGVKWGAVLARRGGLARA
jgi:hypothetical protein